MKDIISIKVAVPNDYSQLMKIWETSVKSTHDFLAKSDFELLKTIIPRDFFPQVKLFSIFENDEIKAFLGVSDDNLEMLFVNAASRGKGLGKFAVDYALNNLKIYKVDVNEQNLQAVGFYKKLGYHQIGRSEVDGMGKPYPLLHLEFPHQG